MDLEKRKLLFATEGRKAETLGRFREDLEVHGARAEQIKEFCLDMSAAYRKGIAQAFPLAGITFDKFHLMKLVPGSLRSSGARRNQRSRQSGCAATNSRSVWRLKGSHYVWIKNPQNLTNREIAISDALQPPRLNLRKVRAYHMRTGLATFPSRCLGLSGTVYAWNGWDTPRQAPTRLKSVSMRTWRL